MFLDINGKVLKKNQNYGFLSEVLTVTINGEYVIFTDKNSFSTISDLETFQILSENYGPPIPNVTEIFQKWEPDQKRPGTWKGLGWFDTNYELVKSNKIYITKYDKWKNPIAGFAT